MLKIDMVNKGSASSLHPLKLAARGKQVTFYLKLQATCQKSCCV